MQGILKHVALMRCVCASIAPGLLALLLFAHANGGTPDAEVLPPGVVVRQTPGSPAAVGTLSAGARVEVLFTQSGPAGSWSQVALPSGQTGFVPDTSLRRLTSAPQWRAAAPDRNAPGGAGWTRRGAVEVPLKRIGGVLLVASRINNQVATNFIVDTGASVVTISHAVADRLGLEYAGKPTQRLITPSGIMHSPRVVLDAVHVPDETGAGVSSVDAVVATVPGSPPDIGGLLGQSFLRNFHVTIDAERGVMHLQSVGAAAGISR